MGRKLVLIGNAHLDICWLWDFEEGFQEVRATFRSAVDRIKEFGEHVFTSASSLHYELVQKTDKTLFEEIRKAVASGRWHIVGGWYLQPDCNAPNGESFARHGLYGQRYFEKNFGVKATTGYNVDSFGHNANLPQILKLQGMDSYVFMRPEPQEADCCEQHAFLWKGIDGTTITAGRVPISYASVEDWGTGLRRKLPQELRMAEDSGIPLMCFYGVGDHGGGPTSENLEYLRNFIRGREDEDEIAFGTTREYFDLIKKFHLDTFEGELQHHAIGCYSLMADIKHLNARCENELMRAERLAYLLRDLEQTSRSTGFFEKNWKRVLFNQFHDILGGCCAAFVYDGVRNRYGHTLDDMKEFACELVQKLGSHIDTSDGVLRLVVVNTLPWKVTETIELNSIVERITDSDGGQIDFQFVKAEPTANLSAFHTRVSLDLPAFGYKSWNLYGETPMPPPALLVGESVERVAGKSIGNEDFTINFNSRENEIGPVLHRGKTILKRIYPVVIEDGSDAWAHTLARFDGMRRKLDIEEVRVYADGAVSKEYEVRYVYGRSEIKLRVRANKNSSRLELDSDVFWAERRKMLKLVFETEGESGLFWSEIPYGFVSRKSDGDEWPCQRWISKKSGDLFVAVLNDGVCSCASEKGSMEYGVLRSPAAAHHYPANLTRTTFHSFTDQGEHKARFAIVVGKDNSGFSKAAAEFNQKPFFIIESTHQGDWPSSSEDDMDIPGCYISAIKPSEDGKGYVFRVVETTGGSHVEKARLMGRETALVLNTFEIKSLHIDPLAGIIEETDLLEKAKV